MTLAWVGMMLISLIETIGTKRRVVGVDVDNKPSSIDFCMVIFDTIIQVLYVCMYGEHYNTDSAAKVIQA